MAAEALIIAAHGDCDGAGENLLAQELARRLRQSGGFSEVVIGLMRGQPSIENAVAQIRSDRIRVYPLFLSDGYYVKVGIPQRLGITNGIDALGHHISIDPPLGLNERLPSLLAQSAKAVILRKGVPLSDAHLLLVAHGSKHAANSAETATAIMHGMAEQCSFASMSLAFLDEPPYFTDVVVNVPRPCFILGLFAGGGLHAVEDMQKPVTELNDKDVHIIEQMGGYADIIDLIAADFAA